ncbi:MAG: 6-phosphogluconolactonase [Patescibacteria group bacterium]
MTNPLVFHFETEAEFWDTALEDVLLCIREALRKFPDCRLGLAGGSTPKALYEKLADANLPWGKIKIIQLDERYVPSDHKESNLGMLRKTLLTRAPIPPNNIFTFDTSLPYDSAAEEMDRQLTRLQEQGRPLLDCLILGAGSDGHIASLFEGDRALLSPNYAATAHAKGYPTPQRLTLTTKALQEASCALLLLKGPDKLPVVENLEGKSSSLPLTALKFLASKATLKVLYSL